MRERKHIDRLYQEKFKDFEATPREAVWKGISKRLQEKDRKRSMVPLWYKIAGIAAVLALFLNFASELFRTTGSSQGETAAVIKNEGPKDLSIASATYTNSMFRSSLILSALMQNTKNLKAKESTPAPKQENKIRNVAFVNIITAADLKDSGHSPFSFSGYKGIAIQNTELQEENKLPIKPDFPLTSLENDDMLEKKAGANSYKKMRISTIAAPVMFDKLGSGSAVDAQFAKNPSKGELTMSYGINFAYQISEKIKIRSGISKVDLSYNTHDIAFTAAVNPVALSSINYGGEIPNFRIENRSVRQFSNFSASTEFNRASLASPTAGYINQSLGYIEIPLEIEYVIIDKKIGFNIIGGASTLFLNENMISLNSSDFSTNLGEANNLNNLSFSTNLGVGVDYKISPQFQLNLEPIFKYQINTFSNTSGNLNPYYFGIYSGFSFKF